MRFIVPEVVDYELRRELLRLGNVRALSQLDAFILAEHDRYLALTTRAMRLAAELWARSRRQGMPTADPHALDIDVLLSAQILSHSVARSDFVVATSNVAHLSLFVPAKSWNLI
jgi:predicted nucleic acid-binding protein